MIFLSYLSHFVQFYLHGGFNLKLAINDTEISAINVNRARFPGIMEENSGIEGIRVRKKSLGKARTVP